jgi:hypothetical protein
MILLITDIFFTVKNVFSPTYENTRYSSDKVIVGYAKKNHHPHRSPDGDAMELNIRFVPLLLKYNPRTYRSTLMNFLISWVGCQGENVLVF